MKLFGFKPFHKNQAGFTLIEVLAAIAITGIIGLAASISAGQLLNQTSRDTDYTAASRHAANAIYWISHDTLMAQQIEGYEDFPAAGELVLTWMSWDNTAYTASYAVEDGALRRTYSDGTNISTTLIAQYINTGADKTYCTFDDGILTVTVTSSVGEGARVVDVTKTRKITNRPKL